MATQMKGYPIAVHPHSSKGIPEILTPLQFISMCKIFFVFSFSVKFCYLCRGPPTMDLLMQEMVDDYEHFLGGISGGLCV